MSSQPPSPPPPLPPPSPSSSRQRSRRRSTRLPRHPSPRHSSMRSSPAFPPTTTPTRQTTSIRALPESPKAEAPRSRVSDPIDAAPFQRLHGLPVNAAEAAITTTTSSSEIHYKSDLNLSQHVIDEVSIHYVKAASAATTTDGSIKFMEEIHGEIHVLPPPPKSEAQLCVNLTLVDSYIGLSCTTAATPVSGSSTNDYTDADDSVNGLCNPDNTEDEVALQPPLALPSDPKPLSGRHHHTLEESVDDLAYSVCPAAVTSYMLDGKEAPVVVNSDVVLDALMLKAVSCPNALLSTPQVLLLTLLQNDPGPPLDPPIARSRSSSQPTSRRSGQEIVTKNMDANVLAIPSSTTMEPARCLTKGVQLEVDAADDVVANNFKSSEASVELSVRIPEHKPAAPVTLAFDISLSDTNLAQNCNHDRGMVVKETIKLWEHYTEWLYQHNKLDIYQMGFSSKCSVSLFTAALHADDVKEILVNSSLMDEEIRNKVIMENPTEGMFDALLDTAKGRRTFNIKAWVLILHDSRGAEELKLQQLIVHCVLEGSEFSYESRMPWDPSIIKLSNHIQKDCTLIAKTTTPTNRDSVDNIQNNYENAKKNADIRKRQIWESTTVQTRFLLDHLDVKFTCPFLSIPAMVSIFPGGREQHFAFFCDLCRCSTISG